MEGNVSVYAKCHSDKDCPKGFADFNETTTI